LSAGKPKVVVLRLCFPLLEHARKVSVNKRSKTNGGWIMKAKSLLISLLVSVTGLTWLSLPAGAECWMTCPPGSTATPSAMGKQDAAATAEPVTSSEELTQAKKPEATAKAAPAPAPKASPSPAAATTEPAASPELTQAKKPEATAKASPAPAPAKPKAASVPAGAGPATEAPPVQSATPTPAPTQDAVAPPAPVPQSSETNAAFQPAPSKAAPPAPVPIPGPVPGTATMHVIPE
jgi:hypothetical protein